MRRSSSNPIRWLLIGAGKMGAAHAAAVARVPGVQIVGIASRTGERARRLASTLPDCEAADDWRVLADRCRPDACLIAVSHLESETVATEALDRGIPILAEKPVALTSAAVRALSARAADRRVLAAAAMNRRFYSSVLAAIETVRLHGAVRGVHVVATDPVKAFRAQGTYAPTVYDQWFSMNTLHAVDLLRLVAGEPNQIVGVGERVEGETAVAAAIGFAGGVVGSFSSHGPASSPWEFRVYGEGVSAALSPLERGWVQIGDSRPRELTDARSNDGVKAGLREQMTAFSDAVRGGADLPWPMSSLSDHARSLDLADAIQACVLSEVGRG